MKQNPVEILIFGAGAVGATFGWRAAQNPHVRVTAVCRSNYNVVKKQGFLMKSKMWGNGHFIPHRVVRDVEEVRGVTYDYTIFSNKIVDTPGSSFIKTIRPVIQSNTTLVSAQNGFCVEPPLRSAFPENPILSAVCYVSCVQNTPGTVEQVAQIRPHAFHIGTYLNGDAVLADSKLETLVQLDPRFRCTTDIDSERWAKLIFNGSWNPVAAIYRMTTQEVYQTPQALDLVKSLADEIYTVAVACGINLPCETPMETTNCARNQPPITLSMLQDVRSRHPLELEALCGSILRRATMLNVSAPTLFAVYRQLVDINGQISSSSVCPTRMPLPVNEPVSHQNWSLAAKLLHRAPELEGVL